MYSKKMFKHITKIEELNLRALAELSAKHRTFLTVYFNGRKEWEDHKNNIKKIEVLLKEHPDELEHFRMNIKMLEETLDNNIKDENSNIAAFCCWAMDYCEVYSLPFKTSYNLFKVDSSPFIRPLAELNDEYESCAIVISDNRATKIFMLSSEKSNDLIKSIKGNIKNHVKVGGWSQKRYSRRRDKQIHHYVKDICEELVRLDHETKFDRIVFLGSEEILRSIKSALPSSITTTKELIDKIIDLGRSENEIQAEIDELIGELEIAEEKNLWDKIKNELFAGGLGVTGLSEVIDYAESGRLDSVIVEKTLSVSGARCRKCDHLQIHLTQCEKCNSADLYEVGLVNELVELLTQSSASIEFCDRIEELHQLGGIAGLLRY